MEHKDVKNEAIEKLKALIKNHRILAGTDSLKQALAIKRLLDSNPDEKYVPLRHELKKHFIGSKKDEKNKKKK